jgi:hypothetical protein
VGARVPLVFDKLATWTIRITPPVVPATYSESEVHVGSRLSGRGQHAPGALAKARLD